MSVKRFEGWEPAEVHEHEYDAGGCLIRTVVTREAEWDDDERDMILALALYRSQLCPSGHWLPDAAAPQNEYGYTGRNSRCHACTAIGVEQERLKDNPPGLLFGATLKVEPKRG